MENDIQVYERSGDLIVNRPPELVLDEAKKAAKALDDVLKNKKKPVIMNGEQYLEFEDWQTVGRFYGITAKVVSTNFIEYGEVKGFEAKAVALRIDGMEISGAEAMCLNDEQNWKIKPLFQLRSMAQTRACAKALRNVLAWVVVLAGYRPTPAEEIQDMIDKKPPIQQPQEKKGEPPAHPFTTCAIDKVESKKGETKGKPWTRHDIFVGDTKYGTFSESFAKLAQKSIDEKLNAVITYSETDRGRKVENIVLEEGPEPGSKDA